MRWLRFTSRPLVRLAGEIDWDFKDNFRLALRHARGRRAKGWVAGALWRNGLGRLNRDWVPSRRRATIANTGAGEHPRLASASIKQNCA